VGYPILHGRVCITFGRFVVVALTRLKICRPHFQHTSSFWHWRDWNGLFGTCVSAAAERIFLSIQRFGFEASVLLLVSSRTCIRNVCISKSLHLVKLHGGSSCSRKNFSKRGPEARLYWACAAAFLFPIGMFIYAWTTLPGIPWIATSIGIAVSPSFSPFESLKSYIR